MFFTVWSVALGALFLHALAHPTSLSVSTPPDGGSSLDVSPLTISKRSPTIDIELVPVVGNAGPGVFYIPVTVGSKTLNLVFDTGSNLLWAYSTLMNSTEFAGKPKFDVKDGIPVPCDPPGVANYVGKLEVDFSFYNTSVVVSKDIASVNVSIGAAKAVRNMQTYLMNSGMHGILGANLSPISWLSLASKASGSLAAQFTLDLTIDPNGKSTLKFGDFDATPVSGEISWLSVPKNQDQWSVYSSSHGNVIFDSGATGIMLTVEYAERYFATLGDKAQPLGKTGLRHVPCEGTTLPDFRVNLGGNIWDIAGSVLMGPQVKPGRCGVLVGQITGDVSYLGIRFIQKYIVMYDVKEREVGIAKRPS